jgi:hypothetical protein
MVVSKVQCAFSTIAGSPEQHCVDCQLENKGFVFVEANKALCCLTVRTKNGIVDHYYIRVRSGCLYSSTVYT